MKYQYDAKSGELLSELDVAYDAAYLTDKKPPPANANEVAIYVDENGDVPRRANDGVWKVVPDFRGVKYWLDHDTSTIISELGRAIPDDAFLEQPERPLNVFVEESLSKVESAVADWHDKVAGTPNQRRQSRFQLNHVAAERIIAGTASEDLVQAMQTMLASNKVRKPDVYGQVSLNDFCHWIIKEYEKSLIGSIYTETTYINTLSQLEKAESAERLEQGLVSAAQEAEEQYQRLQNMP